jgi:NTP pyrophosphatase (non-canonical NTP hydrolase)
MKDYFELEVAVEQWAEEKGILSKATPIKQAMKTQEELTELCNAILDNNKEEIKDAIGDIMVTLIIQAKMQEMTIEECLNAAYDVISKRTGKMVNGQFMKDETGHYGFINNNQTHT